MAMMTSPKPAPAAPMAAPPAAPAAPAAAAPNVQQALVILPQADGSAIVAPIDPPPGVEQQGEHFGSVQEALDAVEQVFGVGDQDDQGGGAEPNDTGDAEDASDSGADEASEEGGSGQSAPGASQTAGPGQMVRPGEAQTAKNAPPARRARPVDNMAAGYKDAKRGR